MRGDAKRRALARAMAKLGPNAPLDQIAYEAKMTRGGAATMLKRMGGVRTARSISSGEDRTNSRWTLPGASA